MFRKISVKVAVFVNVVLFVVIALGTILLVNKQYANLDEQYKTQAKFDSALGAKAVGRLIEEAIDNGVFPVQDAFDTEYSVIPNFDPPKYHTKYDFYTDKALLSLQDEMLKNPNIVFAVTVDKNGYLPTHNSKYQQPITGDKEKDKLGNRTKRIFNDKVGLAAAQNTQDGFLQVYKRDTGETMWDVATPILVKGKQWGNFRIGLSIAALQKAKMNLLIELAGIMVLILIISTVAIIYTVKTTLHPMTVLTQIASRMADGDVNEKIVATSEDEIGELAEVLERMRISLKTAMDRLMKK
jgi:methyl-accepting chemotaxis protein